MAGPPGLDTLIQSSPRPAWPCPPPSPAPLAYRWLRSWWSETHCPGWWSSHKHAPSPSSPAACHWLRGGPWRKKWRTMSSDRQNRVCMDSLCTSSNTLTSSEFLHRRKNGAGGRTGFCWTWAYFSGIRNRWHVSWTHNGRAPAVSQKTLTVWEEHWCKLLHFQGSGGFVHTRLVMFHGLENRSVARHVPRCIGGRTTKPTEQGNCWVLSKATSSSNTHLLNTPVFYVVQWLVKVLYHTGPVMWLQTI